MGVLLAPEPLEQTIVEYGEPLEVKREVSGRHVWPRADGNGASSLMVDRSVVAVIPIIRGSKARDFDHAKGNGLWPLRLGWRALLIPAVLQDLGLNPKQIGLDGGRAPQTPQQRCQPKHQLAFDGGPGVIICDERPFELSVVLDILD